jgi:hypothetical protein
VLRKRRSHPLLEGRNGRTIPFEKSFDGLPDEAHAVIREHLASDLLEPARPAPAAEVERCAAADEVNAELTKEWGKDPGKSLAKLQDRINGMIAADSAAIDKALAWFDGLPTKQAKAVLKALAR